MENNQENVQNEVVNDVEQNVNNNKPQKSNKRKMIVLLVIVVILLLAAGACGWYLLSNKDNGNTNNGNENTTEQSVENKVEKSTSKKIDESKDWVYDAEYGNNKTVKTIESSNSEANPNSKEDLVVPYININSDDAKRVNEEIKNLYNKKYEEYGTMICRLNYKYYINDKILSVIVEEGNVAIQGGAGLCPLYVYNFNLDTLKTASLEEMAQLCGFNSESDVQNKVKGWKKRQNDLAKANPDKVVAQMTGIVDGKYFIDKDKKLNFIYISAAAGTYYTPAVVEPNKEIEDFYDFDNDDNSAANVSDSNTKIQNYHQDNFLFLNAAGLKNKTYESLMNENGPNYRIDFDQNGNPTIKITVLGEGIGSEVYGTYNSFYSIVQSNNWPESGIETASFKFKDLNGVGSEQNGVINYSLVTDNETIELKLTVPYGEEVNKGIILYDMKKIIEGKFLEFNEIHKSALTEDLDTTDVCSQNENYVYAPKFKEKIEKICVQGLFDNCIINENGKDYIGYSEINSFSNLVIKEYNFTEKNINAIIEVDSSVSGYVTKQQAEFELININGKWLVQRFEIL